jgi:hypothetical protein
MCIACEQELMWLAYLESREPDSPDSLPPRRSPFADFPGKPSSAPAEQNEPAAATAKANFACDDPTAE